MVVITPHLHVVRLEPTHFVHRQKIKIFFNWRYIAGLNLDQIVHHPSVQLINLSLHQSYCSIILITSCCFRSQLVFQEREQIKKWKRAGVQVPVQTRRSSYITFPCLSGSSQTCQSPLRGGGGGACIFHKVAHVF